MEFRYEQLRVNRVILDYINQIYSLTKAFPDEEKFGLSSQIRRASISIYLNLAEGSSRNTKPEFVRFLNIALGSLTETDACLKIALNLDYIDQTTWNETRALTEQLWISLAALRKSQQT